MSIRPPLQTAASLSDGSVDLLRGSTKIYRGWARVGYGSSLAPRLPLFLCTEMNFRQILFSETRRPDRENWDGWSTSCPGFCETDLYWHELLVAGSGSRRIYVRTSENSSSTQFAEYAGYRCSGCCGPGCCGSGCCGAGCSGAGCCGSGCSGAGCSGPGCSGPGGGGCCAWDCLTKSCAPSLASLLV